MKINSRNQLEGKDYFQTHDARLDPSWLRDQTPSNNTLSKTARRLSLTIPSVAKEDQPQYLDTPQGCTDSKCFELTSCVRQSLFRIVQVQQILSSSVFRSERVQTTRRTSKNRIMHKENSQFPRYLARNRKTAHTQRRLYKLQ